MGFIYETEKKKKSLLQRAVRFQTALSLWLWVKDSHKKEKKKKNMNGIL